MSVKMVQVVDLLSENFPHEIEEPVWAAYECANGSYNRYYFDGGCQFEDNQELVEKFNALLEGVGVKIDKEDKYAYVLLYISW